MHPELCHTLRAVYAVWSAWMTLTGTRRSKCFARETFSFINRTLTPSIFNDCNDLLHQRWWASDSGNIGSARYE